MFNYLRKKNFHIYCLQDTHFIKDSELRIRSEWGGNCEFSSFRCNSRGVCVLFNYNFSYKIHSRKNDEYGNFLALDVSIDDHRITLVSLYGQNNDNPNFFHQILDIYNEFENQDIIICGDFNLVQNQELDTYNYLNVNNPNAKEKILSIKQELNLTDPYREFHQDTKKFTWRKTNPIKQSRLDFFLVSDTILQSITDSNILPGYRTDHSIIYITLKFNEFQRGRGLWKFNNDLLKDPTYLEIVKKCILRVKKQYCVPVYDMENIENIKNDSIQFTINDQLFLEILLLEIRGKTISYS